MRGLEKRPSGGDPLDGVGALPRLYPYSVPSGDRPHPPDPGASGSIGHPLLGDVVYGAKKPVPGLAGQCLHARRLSFVHPRTGERVTVECPLPAYFTQVLTKLRHLV